jgi:hypothetical protein
MFWNNNNFLEILKNWETAAIIGWITYNLGFFSKLSIGDQLHITYLDEIINSSKQIESSIKMFLKIDLIFVHKRERKTTAITIDRYIVCPIVFVICLLYITTRISSTESEKKSLLNYANTSTFEPNWLKISKSKQW